MNPYLDIKDGIEKNRKSPNYGRYRLSFNQAYPFREPLYNRLVLKVNNEKEAKIIFGSLPKHLNFFHFFKQKDIRENKYWLLDFFEDNDSFIVLEILSDVKYIALENIYYSIVELAPYLEDCHFFIYSTGDDDDRWIDEYIIKNGEVTLERHLTDIEIYLGRLDFYIKRVESRPNDFDFKKFTLFQLYSRMHFWMKDFSKYSNKNLVTRSSLSQIYKHYLTVLYSIDHECEDFCSLNKKYNFESMM